MQSSIYKLGEQRGREEGFEPMVRLFARRIGRPLAASERAMLLQRLDTLGPDRLVDVSLALSTEDLTAWLADPAAT